MRVVRKLPLLLLVLISSAGFAQTQEPYDGYYLRQALQRKAGTESEAEFNFNLGYVAGIARALDGEGFCLPPGQVRFGEMKEVVLKYIGDHPTMLHKERALVIGLALADAYPCINGRKAKRKSKK